MYSVSIEINLNGQYNLRKFNNWNSRHFSETVVGGILSFRLTTEAIVVFIKNIHCHPHFPKKKSCSTN